MGSYDRFIDDLADIAKIDSRKQGLHHLCPGLDPAVLSGINHRFQELLTERDLCRGRVASEDPQIGVIDVMLFFRLRIAKKAFRGELCLRADERMIHHEQCLRSNRAEVAAAGHQAGIGKVEHFKQLG